MPDALELAVMDMKKGEKAHWEIVGESGVFGTCILYFDLFWGCHQNMII